MLGTSFATCFFMTQSTKKKERLNYWNPLYLRPIKKAKSLENKLWLTPHHMVLRSDKIL